MIFFKIVNLILKMEEFTQESEFNPSKNDNLSNIKYSSNSYIEKKVKKEEDDTTVTEQNEIYNSNDRVEGGETTDTDRIKEEMNEINNFIKNESINTK